MFTRQRKLLGVGVYFEANGHGTVVFQHDKLESLLRACNQTVRSRSGYQRLRLLPTLINPAVGDASISDMLLVDLILQYKGWRGDAISDMLLVDLILQYKGWSLHTLPIDSEILLQ
jgi:hypothetical protein